MLAVRAAEAAAVGGTAGGLACAFVMAAWILAGRFVAAAAGLSAAPLSAGVVLAALPAAARKLRLTPTLRWTVAALMAAAGAGATAAVLTGAFVHLPKNWLVLIIPAAAAATALVALLRGAPLSAVAASADRRALLQERLRTAWELTASQDESTFARAVRQQALARADEPHLRGVSFWTRTPATLGALGLAILAAALMLPWRPLQSPAALARQRWRQVRADAGQVLSQQLAMLAGGRAAESAQVASAIRRLRAIAGRLGSAEVADARDWRGPVVDLAELAESLRRAIRSGQLDPAAAELADELIRTIDHVAEKIARGMGQTLPLAAGEPAPTPATRPARRAVSGYATVYHGGYGQPPPTTAAAPPTPASPATVPAPPQVPYEQAWAAARRRAAAALSRRDVPAPYRQLVRDFFAADR